MSALARLTAAVAATALAYALGACASADAPAAGRNAAKQEELQKMEGRGQRNDDRPVRVE